MATDFRTFENINGYSYSYDADKTDTIYAEDLNSITAAVNNLEDEIDGVPAQISAAVAAAVAATKDALYPVGSIYMNYSVSTNPATLLGFGSWSQFSRGRVLVGQADSGTFATAGATGGEETHTLTTGQMPVHGFSFSIHGQENGTDIGAQGVTGGSIGGSTIARYGNHGLGNTGANSRQNPSWSWGNDEPHNNLQPYLVVYMWRRTA